MNNFKEFAEGMKLISEAIVPVIRVIGEVSREQGKAESLQEMEMRKLRCAADREDRILDATCEREIRKIEQKEQEDDE